MKKYALLLLSAANTLSYAACDSEALERALIRDDLGAFLQYQKHCPLKNDAQGFTPYERVALYGADKIVNWMKSHQKIPALSLPMRKLLQGGLRFLGYDAGIIDGQLGARTKDAIRSFQKAVHHRATGTLSAEELGLFHQQIAKKAQQILQTLGYRPGPADGVIGDDTQKALRAFRKKTHLPNPRYENLDEAILYQLMLAQNDWARAHRATKANKHPAPRPPSKTSKAASHKPTSVKKAIATKKPVVAVKAAPVPKVKPRPTPKAPVVVQSFRPAVARPMAPEPTARPVIAPPQPQAVPTPAAAVQPLGHDFQQIRGVLSHQSKSVCSINGHPIGAIWCEAYPQDSGKTCTAVISKTGATISLLCEKK